MNDFISAPRRRALLAAAGLCLSAALTPAYAAEPLKVVASFSILGDIVEVRKGCERDHAGRSRWRRRPKGSWLARSCWSQWPGLQAWLPRLEKASGFAQEGGGVRRRDAAQVRRRRA